MRNLRQTRISGTTLCTTKVFRIEQDQVAMPSGLEVTRAVVRKASAAVIIPITAEGNVLLVRQWRYAVNQALLELPAGVFDPGEDPESSARREMQEETGYYPHSLIQLNTSYPMPGICDESLHYFLARNLEYRPLPGDEDEDIELVELTFDRALADPLIRQDGKSILGLLLAKEYLEKNIDPPLDT